MPNKITDSYKCIALQNHIMGLSPDFITLRDVKIEFLEKLVEFKFIQETYFITGGFHNNRFSVIMTK